jgi:hypothetical protein
VRAAWQPLRCRQAAAGQGRPAVRRLYTYYAGLLYACTSYLNKVCIEAQFIDGPTVIANMMFATCNMLLHVHTKLATSSSAICKPAQSHLLE